MDFTACLERVISKEADYWFDKAIEPLLYNVFEPFHIKNMPKDASKHHYIIRRMFWHTAGIHEISDIWSEQSLIMHANLFAIHLESLNHHMISQILWFLNETSSNFSDSSKKRETCKIYTVSHGIAQIFQ